MVQKIREKLKLKTILQIIPTVVFLVFVFYMMVQTFSVDKVRDAVKDTEMSFYGLEQLSDSFEKTVQENFYDKNEYINLNGLTTRVLGINSLNWRQKYSNGHLSEFDTVENGSPRFSDVIELDQFLKERDINFIYLMAPDKQVFATDEFSPGYGSEAEENVNKMIMELENSGVDVIDMNSWFKENGWTMDDVYFKTDHHWRPQAALAAADVTMSLLDEQGLVQYDKKLLEENSYTINTLEDWYLGSHGKHVGIYYAGVDDISVYLPNFATDYSFSALISEGNWRYEDSPLNLEYSDHKDYFNSDPYDIYLYGGYPLEQITNLEASNDKRLLITGDSFRRPWGYFLSSQFQEIYIINLRVYNNGSFVQYVEEIQPDIVIMCTRSSCEGDLYSFGIEEYLTALNDTSKNDSQLIDLGDFSLDPQEDNNDYFSVVTAELDSDQTYTMTIDKTSYSGGEDLYIQMTLQDLSTNTAVYNRYFDANSEEKQKWIFTTPDNENDIYAIYLYAGTKGHTQNVSVEVTDVMLYEGVVEN